MRCWTQATLMSAPFWHKMFVPFASQFGSRSCARSSMSYFSSHAVARGFANISAVATWAGLAGDIPAIEAQTGNLASLGTSRCCHQSSFTPPQHQRQFPLPTGQVGTPRHLSCGASSGAGWMADGPPGGHRPLGRPAAFSSNGSGW